MAVKTFYFKDAVPAGATLHRSLQDGGTAPTTATTTTGWNPGTNAVGQCCLQNGGTEVSRTTGWSTTLHPSVAPSQTVGDCWRTENTYTGTFANANWVFSFALRSVTQAFAGRFRLAIRVWRSTNANGTGATELTTARVTSAISAAAMTTTTDTAMTVTWTPAATKTLTNEYLFVNVGVEVTTVGTNVNQDMDFRVGTGLALVTPNFAETFSDGVAEGTVGTCTDSTNATYSCNVTVVPNTADAASLTLTPILEFTGTDAAAHDITYEVQIATDNQFTLPTVLASYNESNLEAFGQNIGGGQTYFAIGQSFQSGAGGTLDSCTFWLYKSGAPTGNVTATLYAHTGTYGTTGTGVEPPLAVSDGIAVTTLTSSPHLPYTFKFSGANRVSLTPGTAYCIVCGYTGPDFLTVGGDTTGAHGGVQVTKNFSGVWGVSGGNDTIFYVRVGTSTLVLDKFSNADAGFVNTVSGGDTDPFTSGQKVSFTAQSALSPGTYYWRVWGQNPGTHSWSPWTTTRSFTAASSGTVYDVAVLEGTRNRFASTEAITNPPWSLGFCSVTQNATTDPWGGSTADKVIPWGVASVQQFVSQAGGALVDSTNYTASIDAKAAGYNNLVIRVTKKDNSQSAAVIFNLAAGNITSGSGGTIESLGSGWYRCSVIFDSGSGSGSQQGITYYYVNTDASFQGDGTSGLYLTGAQFEQGPLTPYQPVLTAAHPTKDTVGAGLALGAAVAEGVTNIFGQPEALDQSPWSVYKATVSANATRAPNGTLTADRIIEDTSYGPHIARQQFYTSDPSLTYTVSAFAKLASAGRPVFHIAVYDDNIDYRDAYFNLATGIAGSLSGGSGTPSMSSSMTGVGDGWYRCVFTYSAPTATNCGIAFSGIPNEASAQYTGDGVSSVYAWGVLLERESSASAYPNFRDVPRFPVEAAVAEGGSTAVDTPDAVLVGVRVGRVAWIRFTAPKGAGTVYPVTVAEGTATALDSPSATEVNAAFIVEGTATALDTSSTALNTSASVTEGAATALDTPNATEVDAASLAEGAVTALDTSATTAVFRPAVVEGTATALDAPSAVSSITAQIAEGIATAVDTPSVRTNFVVNHAEGAVTATDTPSAASAIGASVVEGSPTATDVITADLNQSQSAALNEGGITAQDAPSANAVYAASTVEGSATATDTSATTAVISAADVEGGNTATDTPSVGAAVIPAVIAEVSVTAQDIPSTTAVFAANEVEGTATAADTPSAVTSTGALVAEGSATSLETPSAKSISSVGVFEGTATALDTQQTIATFVAVHAEGASTALDTSNGDRISPNTGEIAEGSATANDTPSAKAVWVSSVAEVSASAQDTPSATAVWKASVAEVSVGLDTPSAGRTTPAAVVEGSATAVATQNGDRQANADIAEISTAVDTVSTTSVYQSLVVEGGDTASDLVVAFGDNEAFIFEVASLHDTVSAQVPDRGADRTPYFQIRSTAYVFADPYRHLPVYIPVDTPQPGYVEESEPAFEFTKPLVPSAKYTPLEKRVAKF